jgi:glycosyltransferase involved in cell wall biosynthesis
MKISLVCSTFGNRSQNLRQLMNSLVNQQDNISYELIVVVQNNYEAVMNAIQEFSKMINIKYIEDTKLGLSRGRNIGIKHITGDIIGFPDDDCWFPSKFFESVINEFNLTQADIIITSIYDPVRRKYFHSKMDNSVSRWLKREEIFYPSSISIFFKRELIDRIRGKYINIFNESLGIGTYFGSGEEIDLIIKTLHIDAKIWINPNIFVCHPVVVNFHEALKIRSYARGLGALMKEYGKEIPTIRKYYYKTIIKSIGGSIVRGVRYKGAFKYYLWRLLGLLEGYCKWTKENTG